LVDQVVEELNQLYRRAALDAALKMGQLIVDRFYRGDLTAWRNHAGKEASFRKLAARADRDLQVSPTGLWRAVALYELTTRLELKNIRHLGMTHLRLVLGLPDHEQRRLLTNAEQMGWDTERLEEETAMLRGKLGNRAGRPPVLPLVRAIRSLASDAQRARRIAATDEFLSPLSREQVRSLYTAMEAIKSAVDQVQRALVGSSGGTMAAVPALERPASLSGRKVAR
jgi:hypothetical protein